MVQHSTIDHTGLTGVGDVAAHEADSTSVHGITNTANLYASGGTDVAVADGGTGASTAGAARTNLGISATNTPFTPNGSIAATDVQAAIQEVRDEAGAGTTVATDAIWDAAGDTVVGSGADTAARLAIGNVGGALRRINGTVQWDSRTSMPTAATGDIVYRSDLSGQWFYNGTIWLSLAAGQLAFPLAVALPLAGTAAAHRMALPQALGGSDIYLAEITIAYYVDGGTALSGSHKWVGEYIKSGGASSASLGTSTIASGASSQWLAATTIAINAAAVSATYISLEGVWTKTGTPGNLYVNAILSFRTIAT